MADSTIWWLLAGVLVALELLTGTFYLLMLAIGMVGAALIAHTGVGLPFQLLVAAFVGGGAVVAWHLIKSRKRAAGVVSANRNVNLDVGETVQVDVWNADGTAAVKYRGAQWTVVQKQASHPQTGLHRIVEMVGNRLLVEKI